MSIVTNLNDSGVGSLRAAIASANAGETISFDPSLAGGTISLSSSLTLNQNLTIDASSAAGITLNGNNSTRIIAIGGTGLNVTIKDLIFRNGRAIQDSGQGGAIATSNGTQLTVENSQFFDNVATGEGGGAIWTGYQSTTTILNSTFDGNQAIDNNSERAGGAIAGASEGNLTVRDSLFNNNQGATGGAINSLLGGLRVENSVFTNNQSTGNTSPVREGGNGGAIYTDGASATTNASTQGTITISNSRFDNNQGFGQGGGLFLFAYDGDTVTVENSTIVNNTIKVKNSTSEALGGGLRFGGGASLTVSNTTFLKNHSALQGGGMWTGENSPFTIFNSVFCENEAISANSSPGLGGGLLVTGNPIANITQTTIAGNIASFQGGGFWGGGTGLTLTDSLVANNEGQTGFNLFHQTGTQFSDGGGNFQSLAPNPNDTKVTAGVTLLDPQLGTCSDNGTAMQNPPEPGNSAVTGGAIAGTPVLGTVPNMPANLIATEEGGQIKLTWQDNSNNETGFLLERSQDQNSWGIIANVATNLTQYLDTSLTTNGTYYYRLRAVNGVGQSQLATSNAIAFNGKNTSTGSNPNSQQQQGNSQQHSQQQGIFPVQNSSSQSGVFQLGKSANPVNLQINLQTNATQQVHELGVFVVDDEQGRVNGLKPGDSGYFNAALSKAQIIFSALPQNTFPQFNYTRNLSFSGGEQLAFFLIRDRTTEQVLADGDFSPILYSIQSTQTFSSGDGFILAWEDGSGNADFQDLQVRIGTTSGSVSLTTTFQGKQQGEAIDLRSFTGIVAAEFITASLANYQNSCGFYLVDDPLTGEVNGVLPGEENYAQTAVQQSLNLNAGLPGGGVVVPFLIANGTVEEFLRDNPDNSPIINLIAYFPYLEANPDGIDHVRLLGDNLFGFEDLYGGGDRDYNDWVVQVTVNV
ncbi:DUF4114 domain-containing protein [Spirulina sp. 06S082]|uniref:DUF4114 domain-containing protein n=1 Tax=Spirulina sp. 06S082 TaxID=3110248 RepID=UPI002B206F2A|nr:DUF4114 domain-containing protein [Spirulina sp. 06S082]MEA5469011.1 DUF4114 domain-containing protein [Spirulina sp. 06S082]